MFWQLVYNLFAVPIMFIGFYGAGCCNPKIKEGIKGRKRVFGELTDQLQTARNLEKTTWFHFTSVGEFEQAKPLIEAIYAETRIVLTSSHPPLHQTLNLIPTPMLLFTYRWITTAQRTTFDTSHRTDVNSFFQIDIWPNLVWKAAKYGIPIIVVAGTLHAESKRLARFAKPFFRSVHRHIRVHCAISEGDAARFQELCSPIHEIVVTGRLPAMSRFIGGQSQMNPTLNFSPGDRP